MMNMKCKSALQLSCLTLPQDPLNMSLFHLPQLFDCLTLTNVNAAFMLVLPKDLLPSHSKHGSCEFSMHSEHVTTTAWFVTRWCVCLGFNLDAAFETLL